MQGNSFRAEDVLVSVRTELIEDLFVKQVVDGAGQRELVFKDHLVCYEGLAYQRVFLPCTKDEAARIAHHHIDVLGFQDPILIDMPLIGSDATFFRHTFLSYFLYQGFIVNFPEHHHGNGPLMLDEMMDQVDTGNSSGDA